MNEPSYAGDRLAAKQRQEARDSELARKYSIELAMSTPMGRRFIWDQLASCHVFSMSYTPGSFDATAFREGERNIGQRLMMDVQRFAPNEYLMAVRENAAVKLKPEEEDEDEES